MMCFSLYLKLLWPLLLPLHLWQLCALGHCPSLWLISITSTSVGQTTSGQHDVILLPKSIPRDTMRSSVGLTSMLQNSNLSPRCLQAYSNYAMDPVQVSWASYWFICHMLVSVIIVWFLISGLHMAAMFTNGSSPTGVWNTTTLWSIPLAGIYAS